jgi:hypothetical protein
MQAQENVTDIHHFDDDFWILEMGLLDGQVKSVGVFICSLIRAITVDILRQAAQSRRPKGRCQTSINNRSQ